MTTTPVRSHRSNRRLIVPTVIAVASTALISALSPVAFAQSTDAEFSVLQKARKFMELDQLAQSRLAQNAKDDVALWYLARQFGGDAKRRDGLIQQAEQCIKDLPQSARCHNAIGVLYGVVAQSGGMTAGMKYAGRIRDSFAKAVELDGTKFEFRRDLNQYYLVAPGIVGGSVRKAIENSESFMKIDPVRGRLLRAEVHASEKEFDNAEAMLDGIKSSDASLNESVQQAYGNLGFQMIAAEKFTGAQKLFEKLIAANPQSAVAHSGLGRSLLEQKNVDAAIASLERAVSIDPKVGAHYRLGIAYQTKGDKAKATQAFQSFLGYQTQGRAADDARKRLEDLKRG
jgi:tetratricopeptide (TPR) repeat protein